MKFFTSSNASSRSLNVSPVIVTLRRLRVEVISVVFFGVLLTLRILIFLEWFILGMSILPFNQFINPRIVHLFPPARRRWLASNCELYASLTTGHIQIRCLGRGDPKPAPPDQQQPPGRRQRHCGQTQTQHCTLGCRCIRSERHPAPIEQQGRGYPSLVASGMGRALAGSQQ